ncbi:MAG: phosphoribosylaminoimidazolesuccinocarboxamide synthase [Ignavibacteria bacterium]|jgi:phosphoribosylaminoimidazole-succinocarboxamide synthase|nr:phosphoribosylaminoimidazolesuccinocarboxamide synthase [Ignavibacteria bacterium]MDH7526722.1 phosphoribosylaminoimidazolesuccinocarboxamide synthase [Ignavibacteria bacterium]
MKQEIILETNFENLKLLKRGKVRDIYDLGENLLIVSTDRISAFDVIMNDGIPYKGIVLTKLSEFWFRFTNEIIDNHLITTDINKFPEVCKPYLEQLANRSMLVKKTEVIPIECVVRGYLSGSGWEEYKKSQSVCGVKLPSGLKESDRLPYPIFTPATKEEFGKHDINITEEEAKKIAGEKEIEFIKHKAIEIYKSCFDYAFTKGIIIADTKMEFGWFNDKIILIDELLTPDSSRFWQIEKYQLGKSQESLDKQFLRDYLISINFNRQPPPPKLPREIIEKTSQKYLEIFEIITGEKLRI